MVTSLVWESEGACICLWMCVKQGGKGTPYSVAVDSHRPFNASSTAKDSQCHIHQSRFSVRARQRCWHLNTTQWVRRPLKRQLPDTHPCSRRWAVAGDCQLVTQEKGHCIYEAEEEHSTETRWIRFSLSAQASVQSVQSHLSAVENQSSSKLFMSTYWMCKMNFQNSKGALQENLKKSSTYQMILQTQP